jgi:hypothetical protein
MKKSLSTFQFKEFFSLFYYHIYDLKGNLEYEVN